MTKPDYFTICSKNYLAYALTLGRSLRRADPEARFAIFLADAPLDEAEARDVEFEVIDAASLDLPSFADMTLRYSVMEFNTAIKPTCFQHVFDKLGGEAAVYLDPDICVLAPLQHVEAALGEGARLVLTPHALAPLDDGGDPDDLRLLRTGTYNLGFAAFRDTPESRAFLAWWADRLAADCRVALDDGIFVDQKWMDLAPSYVPETRILRHPGYNAAYWNLMHRSVTRVDGTWRAAGEPLHFFHFSGVVPDDGRVFSKHQDRFGVDDIGDLADLLREYLNQLQANGHGRWRTAPYAFELDARFGAAAGYARAVYRRCFPEPGPRAAASAEALEALCNAPSAKVSSQGGGRITNLTYEIWDGRPDLRRSFDITTAGGRAAFNDWLLASGVSEHAIPERFLAHLAARPDRPRGAARRLLHAAMRRRGALRPVLRAVPEPVLDRARRLIQRAMAPRATVDARAEAARPEAEPELALAYYGYFNAESGVGEAARRGFRALRGVGYPAVARRVSTRGQFHERVAFEFPFDDGEADARIHLIHVNADQTACASEWGGEAVFAPGRRRIGYWAWELEQFPEAWRGAFDRVDEIWVPSRFVRESIQAVTDKPVTVIPHPAPVAKAPMAADRAEARRRFALPEDGVVFLTMFDFNSFTGRKNPDAAIRAFEIARERVPNLALVLKCHGGTRNDPDRMALLDRVRRTPGAFVIDRVLDAEALEALYGACDGVLSLHRSEGFGLTLAEGMARGLPVVATDYSGSTDFIDAEVGVPVPFELVPVPRGAYVQGEGARWAEPDVEAAADALARLASDAGLCARLGEAGRRRAREQLSLDRVGRLMAARLDQAGAPRAAAGEDDEAATSSRAAFEA